LPTRLTDEERADRKMSEKTLNARVIYRAKKYGWRVVRIQRSQVGAAGSFRTGTVRGFPDLILFKNVGSDWPGDGIMYRELKKELGKLDEAQVEWGTLVARAGGNWGVWRPSDLRLGRIEGELNRG